MQSNQTTLASVACSARESAPGFGIRMLPDGAGVQFSLWAPAARQVTLLLEGERYSMLPLEAGWFQVSVAQAKPGHGYQFDVDDHFLVPDPASRFQPQDTHGPSQIVDPGQFAWQDAHWQGRPWEEVILYELHVGTFTPEGTFQGVIGKLDALTALGVTAIELMPIADFTGRRNWGYDGVLPFAPDHAYGTPDDLKQLVQAAHERGLMVFLDVVYNHFGVDGNYLYCYAKPFFTAQHHTPWGDAINFEGCPQVRDFFIQNALYWLNEYHIDGLRLDAVHAIFDKQESHFLRALSQAVAQGVDPTRHVHLVLENDENNVRFLQAKNNGPNPAATQGYEAQWNDDFHHVAHLILTGETQGYYADYTREALGRSPAELLLKCLTEGFVYQGELSPHRHGRARGTDSRFLSSTCFVNFLQNHDQVGNRALGERLAMLSPAEGLRALSAILLLSPAIPLLFMGEEWGATTPFQFFCDFDETLNQQVAAGRRQEFSSNPAFSDQAGVSRIPDPASIDTFKRSHLNWEERSQPEHAAWLAHYQHLIALRRTEIIPRLRTFPGWVPCPMDCKVFEVFGIQAKWLSHEGYELILLANTGSQALTFSPSHLDNILSDRHTVLYQSHATVRNELLAGQIPGWSVIWLMAQSPKPTGKQ